MIRCSRERDDSGEPRFSKIAEIIRQSQFGIHDISRVELDELNSLPRFNMPLELGLFLGAKILATDLRQKKKQCLILDTEPYRYQKFISDIAGQDIRAHGGDVLSVLQITRDWLRTVSKRTLPGPNALKQSYDQFVEQLPQILNDLGHDRSGLQFVDYVNIAREWLLNQDDAR